MVGLWADSMEPEERSSKESLEELAALLDTAGGEAVGRILQNRHKPDPRSFIGQGKVEEVKTLLQATDSTLALFDNELTPSQMRVLSEDLGVRVLDRSGLILDIFAQRAQTREGRLQVELAQYRYLLPRLTGMWTHLDRETAAGGGAPIGTRGTGETQLEDDRRYIRRRIEALEKELSQVRKTRSTQRRLRQKQNIPVIAMVGYTNAGKSTLLNALTGADIQANDRLFDTLDTTTRKLTLSPTCQALLSDTVGFIRKLPHHLIEAFKATLEELTYADVILHVVDVSSPVWQEQASVAERLIQELCSPSTPKLTVYNKADLADLTDHAALPEGKDILTISARTGQGLGELKERLRQTLDLGRKQVKLLIPFHHGEVVDLLHQQGEILSLAYGETGVEVEAILREPLLSQTSLFQIEE